LPLDSVTMPELLVRTPFLWADPARSTSRGPSSGAATLRAALTGRLTHEMIDTADVLPRPSRFA